MSQSLEQKILDGLNEEQRQAVLYEKGPLLIVAGAGTGKTTVITRRIAYLIASKKVKPEEILALTFTEKAAQEMEERVDVLVPYGYTEIWISTFHAFGDRTLRENALELGLAPDMRVLTKPEQIIFFREHLFEFKLDYYRPLGSPAKFIEALLGVFSRAKDEEISPEEYVKYAARLEEKAGTAEEKELAKREMEVALTYEKYQELLAEHHCIDFGDQITLSLKLFSEHPLVLKHYQDRFRYILVDEFQDTNYAQFQLIKMLSSGDKNLTVTGDDDQSIYKFRGAAISNILGFVDFYKDTKQIVLVKSYRSGQQLLDSARNLIVHNNPDRLEVKNKIDKKLKSEKGKGRQVQYLAFDSIFTEADTVAQTIKEQVEKGKRAYKDFAILVRSNNDADPFLRSLNMLGIPWRFSGNQGLYSRPEINLLINFLRVIADFEKSECLMLLSTSEVYELSYEAVTLCSHTAHKIKRSLFFIFKSIETYPDLKERISKKDKDIIVKILKDIDFYGEMAAQRPTGEVLYKFMFDTGYLRKLTGKSGGQNEEKIRNISKFFDMIRRTSQLLEHGNVKEFIDYLNMLIEAGDDPAVVEAEPDENAVNVLTVHKAKGLEFTEVFMVSLISERFPVRHHKESIPLPEEFISKKEVLPAGDFHLQEERRLFYVGMTRSMEELYFTGAQDYGGKRMRKPSRFVMESLDISGPVSSVQKAKALQAITRNAPPGDSQGELFGRIADDELITLSHWQVDDYITCPLKYKFVHVLRLPVLRHHAVVYGSAVHSAVEEYYLRKMRGTEITLQDLIKVFEAKWDSEGFLSREHEEQRFAAGKKTLERFFEKEKNSKVMPVYVEKEFNFQVGFNKITGRWDRIDNENGKIIIVDFKTSAVREQEKADEETEDSMQLGIYALAYKNIYNQIPERVELHFVESGLTGTAVKDENSLNKVMDTIDRAARGIRSRSFEPRPEQFKCRGCAYNTICPSATR